MAQFFTACMKTEQAIKLVRSRCIDSCPGPYCLHFGYKGLRKLFCISECHFCEEVPRACIISMLWISVNV